MDDIFYATTPPGPLISILKTGALQLGNLRLSIRPHLFISPPHVLESLRQQGFVKTHRLLAQNKGSVLLVAKNNPKKIASMADLLDFLLSETVADIYRQHGLRHALDDD